MSGSSLAKAVLARVEDLDREQPAELRRIVQARLAGKLDSTRRRRWARLGQALDMPVELPPPRVRSKKSARRADLFVDNEARVLFLADAVSPSRDELLRVPLISDHSVVLRVKLKELDELEAQAWTGHRCGRLSLPSGRLAVAGGEALFASEPRPRELKLPAGDYRADLYVCPPSPSAPLHGEEDFPRLASRVDEELAFVDIVLVLRTLLPGEELEASTGGEWAPPPTRATRRGLRSWRARRRP